MHMIYLRYVYIFNLTLLVSKRVLTYMSAEVAPGDQQRLFLYQTLLAAHPMIAIGGGSLQNSRSSLL